MLGLRTKQQLAHDAFTMASGHKLVRYHNVTYLPIDFETQEHDPAPDKERTIWLPLSRDRIRRLAAHQFDTVFASDAELKSFTFMVAQNSKEIDEDIDELLVRTPAGLKKLTSEGTLVDVTGDFVPNTLTPVLNEDKKKKAEVFGVIEEWLQSEEEAESLLSHLATSLAPGYSAVKYVLLLGEGRNGKSVLLRMLHAILGNDNVSNVTRQDIALESPVVTDLNGKLLNLVYDGKAKYLEDSGAEKSLIAGEQHSIRLLYDSAPTVVRTNALFIEGLQQEPKSKDKSTALQKRLVRFQFPNVYALDRKFERKMLAPDALGALLSLLIDRYVLEDELAERLAPTTRAIELQLEHMFVNSTGLQFLKHIEETGALGVAEFLGQPISVLVGTFQSWRIKENDLATWGEPDVIALFNPLFNTERRSVRIDGSPRKVRVVTSLKSEAAAFIESLKGDDTDDTKALVAE